MQQAEAKGRNEHPKRPRCGKCSGGPVMIERDPANGAACLHCIICGNIYPPGPVPILPNQEGMHIETAGRQLKKGRPGAYDQFIVIPEDKRRLLLSYLRSFKRFLINTNGDYKPAGLLGSTIEAQKKRKEIRHGINAKVKEKGRVPVPQGPHEREPEL